MRRRLGGAEVPAVLRARRDGVSIGVAVGVVGIAFGVLARAAGLSVGQACVMSLCVFTGASQFASVAVINAGGSGLAALGSALLLASRNALYGPVVAEWFRTRSRLQRFAISQLIIDESAGVGAAQSDPASRRHGFLAAGIGVYGAWNAGTLVGALVGDVVGSIDTWGLDAAFPSVFLALIAPHLRAHPGRLVAVVSAVITAISMPLVPIGLPILLAAFSVLPGAWATQRKTSA